MRPLYELHDVVKTYAGRTVLDVDALHIHPGEILGIVGPSGAGKSTLLRLLNFLEFADSGTLTYRDREITPGTVPLDVRREVTTVFQQPVLLSTDVKRNVAYGLRLRGIHDGRVPVGQALARLGLADLAHAAARTLSGGEAQRVALARAMILRPAVLLLDEPTANLDPHNVNIIESVIRELNEERATTIVLVTHNIFQARRLAHRVALLLNGKIVEATDTATFFDAPRDPRTAAFVNGEMVY